MVLCQTFLILLILLKQVHLQNYDIVLEKMECENLSSYFCHNATCRVRPIKRFVTNLTIECDLRQCMDSALIHFSLNYKVQEYRTFLIDVEEDLCDYFIDKKRTVVMNLLVQDLLAKANINQSCPINKGHIQLKNFQVDARSLPPYIPSGQYRLDLHVTNKQKTKVYLSPKVYFSVRPKGLYKGEMG